MSDDQRARLVSALRSAPGGLGVRELARRLGLHENTIRWHLGVLDDAGAIEAEPSASGRPGRPRMLYRLRPGAAAAAQAGTSIACWRRS